MTETDIKKNLVVVNFQSGVEVFRKVGKDEDFGLEVTVQLERQIGNYRGSLDELNQAGQYLTSSHASIPSSFSCLPALRLSVLGGPGNIVTASHGTRISPGLRIHSGDDHET